jgi:hypothetical protein
MGARAVLTYLKTRVAAANLGIDDIALRPAPRTLAVQHVATQLFIWPRRDDEQRNTYAGTHGYREITYKPMELHLRRTVAADSDAWLAFLGTVESLQALLRTIGDECPINIDDPVTHEGTALRFVHEEATLEMNYARVIRQDAPVTVEAVISTPIGEYMQGPGVV